MKAHVHRSKGLILRRIRRDSAACARLRSTDDVLGSVRGVPSDSPRDFRKPVALLGSMPTRTRGNGQAFQTENVDFNVKVTACPAWLRLAIRAPSAHHCRIEADGPRLAPSSVNGSHGVMRKKSRTGAREAYVAVRPESSADASQMPSQRPFPQSGDVLASRPTARADVYAISIVPAEAKIVAIRYDDAMEKVHALASGERVVHM